MRLLSFCLLVCLISNGIDKATAGSNPLDRKMFSHPVSALKGDGRLDFMVGRSFFRRIWVTAPASTQAADGLGPLYNARSCMACHPNNGRGHAPVDINDQSGQLVLRVDIPPQNKFQQQQLSKHQINNVPDPSYGLQLQNFAIAGHQSEYQLKVSYHEFSLRLADDSQISLRKPDYHITDLGYGTLHPQARFSPRVGPQLIGLGLLEAINEQDILIKADPDDLDNDGISGRPNRVWSNALSKVVLGRFGHKAEKPSINEQVQSAFSQDLGLSVPLFTSAAGDCTSHQTACLTAPNGNSPQYDNLEVNQQIVDLVNFYLSHLAVPARRNVDDPKVLAGEKIFTQIGCNSCHTPYYRTGNGTQAEINHHQEIFPYTDFLLHDMGEALADHRPEVVATGKEWRTAPLWSIGLTAQVSGHNQYLHDGRARSILEAILWHGGEAQAQRDAVVTLDKNSREQLLAFIKSL